MSRFSVKVHDTEGRAKLVLSDGGVVGVVSLSWPAYERLSRDIVSGVRAAALESLKSALGPLIWQEAMNASDGNADLARKRLEELKLDQPKLDQWADHLSRQLAQVMTSFLPEVVE